MQDVVEFKKKHSPIKIKLADGTLKTMLVDILLWRHLQFPPPSSSVHLPLLPHSLLYFELSRITHQSCIQKKEE